MKTHQEVLYHCLTCGAVLQAETAESTHQCCGRPMVLAAHLTINDPEKSPPEPPAGSGKRPQKG